MRNQTGITRRAFFGLGAAAAGAVLIGGTLSSCAPDPHILRVGTKIDVPKFGYQNPATGVIEGFEVGIAHELAKRLKGDPEALQVTGVNVSTRGVMLDNNTLDATLATFTITEARKKSYNFSQPYFTDYIGVLVKKDSGINSFEDLNNKTVGVAVSATTKEKLADAAREAGISMEYAEYATYPEIKIALVTGRVNAFSVDRSILMGYVDDSTKFLDVELAPQDYGVASKKSNTELATQIDEAIKAMKEDKTLAELEKTWGLGPNV